MSFASILCPAIGCICNVYELYVDNPAWTREPGSDADNTRAGQRDVEDQEARVKRRRQVTKCDQSENRESNGCCCRITKGGKLDDLNLAPDSSPFIDSVTREDSFDEGEADQPTGVEGMEVVGRAVEVAGTPMGTRSTLKLTLASLLGTRSPCRRLFQVSNIRFGESGERIRSARVRTARSAR